MRDPNRIDPILARLRAAWIASPDLRLGQLLAGSLAIGGAEDRFNRMFQAECDEFGAVNAPIEWPPVDRPAPTPTPAPGLDLDAVERAERAMTPGPWEAKIYTTHVAGTSQETQWHEAIAGGPSSGTVVCETEWSVFEDESAIGAANIRGIVALRNAAPALIAEVRALRAAAEEREADMHARIRAGYDKTVADAWRAEVAKRDAEIARLTAELARVTECYSESHAAVGQLTRDIDAGREIDRQNVAEVNRLTAELAAAGAVTADVCRYLDCAASDLLAVVTSLYESRARAISDATDARGTVGGQTGPVGKLLGSHAIVEWYLAPDWYQARIGQDGYGMVRRADLRWRHENARTWSSWGRPWGDPAQHMDQPARLVPAAEADADPSQRGPLPKGG